MSKAILALTLSKSLLGCSQASVPDKRRTLTVRLRPEAVDMHEGAWL